MRPDLLEQVRAFLAEHPNATLQDVRDTVGARRSDVAAAIREVRASQHTTPTTGTGGNRTRPGSRPIPDLEGEAEVRETDEGPAIWADLGEIGRLLEQPTDRLLAVLSRIQRSPHLKSEGAQVFALVGKMLQFKETFEAELQETARFLECFHFLARETGQAPDRTVVEELLASDVIYDVESEPPEPETAIESPSGEEESPAALVPVPEPAPIPFPDPPTPEELELRARRIRSMLARQ